LERPSTIQSASRCCITPHPQDGPAASFSPQTRRCHELPGHLHAMAIKKKNDLAYYLIAFRFDLDKKKNGYLGTNNYNYMKSKDNLKYKKYIY
jgi:hypothetical protein